MSDGTSETRGVLSTLALAAMISLPFIAFICWVIYAIMGGGFLPLGQ
jgi:hypothetical protein